jgi:hypothetical protein
MERNVCRCAFSRYNVTRQFAKLAAGSNCVVFAFIEKYSTSKPLKVSPKESVILSNDTVVANERYLPPKCQ